MSHDYVSRYEEPVEYSESECASDGQVIQHRPPSDVTEIYRSRRHQTVSHVRTSPTANYYHHVPGCYETQPSRPCPCNLPPPDPRYCYYKAGGSNNPEGRTGNKNTVSAKKYPITAKTPKYYRCPAAPLCKRPSTLCLPLTCQPDPAVYHHRTSVPRRSPPAPQSPQAQQSMAQDIHMMHHHCAEAATGNGKTVGGAGTAAGKHLHHHGNGGRAIEMRAVDSEGDVNSRLNDLENLLTKFDDEDDDGEEGIEINAVSELSKILKPKVPQSLKAKQQEHVKQTVSKLRAVKPPTNESGTVLPHHNVSKLEVKEAPADESLDVLLRRLSRETLKDTTTDDNNHHPRHKKNSPERGGGGGACSSSRRHVPYMETKPSLDDNSAIELHRSKSYIVSLIDKALSRELGTVPGEKCTRKEFLTMNPRRAIELMNRHTSTKIDAKSMALEATTSTNMTKQKEEKCDCKEEPLYLKQLKQLRWSHLRHIQREAKRLADLERFLDSFGEIDSPP